MDLAKIRKKAKELQQNDGLDPVETVHKSARESASVQAAPVNVEMPVIVNQEPSVQIDPVDTDVFVASEIIDDAEQDSFLVETLTPQAVDPLDELFRQTPDSQLASEENYLRDLTDERDQNEDLRQWLTFSMAAEEYAINIDTIDEICKPREVTEIPNAPAFVLGIISLRGKVVPVFDLKSRLQLGTVAMTPATRIVVCQASGKQVGLLVDSITQVVKLASADIEPPPMVLSGLDRDMIEGVGRSNNKMLILLNLSNVITINKD